LAETSVVKSRLSVPYGANLSLVCCLKAVLTHLLLLLYSDQCLANVNSRSRSLYAIAVPSVCLSSVCNVGVPYTAG